MADNVQLRTFIFIDSMQPQFASYMASVASGYLPLGGQAALYVEIAPGMEINRLMDVALKATRVVPAEQIVERQYGMLELHADEQAEVRQAGLAILNGLGKKEEDRLKPKVVSHQIIRHVDDHQAMLINRSGRKGMMLIAKQTLFIMETYPAGYAVLAANEAEKAANINLVICRPTGAFGRVYIAGEEADVLVASEAALKAVQDVKGTEEQKK
ncbi:MAG: BMC domain-containing protein [Candidatus Sericytochromatia bacterium]|uniref:BMC domain-containing protein n=1 Tax=Candidatus Tanganyikabacteria bacterium TaxID=2961651 RepID=A0A937X2I3_9BACT|nr:BMC domain-containing protein [Candidatus Tanganyikabacteria bacterium]